MLGQNLTHDIRIAELSNEDVVYAGGRKVPLHVQLRVFVHA
jgi:hypothetical protein